MKFRLLSVLLFVSLICIIGLSENVASQEASGDTEPPAAFLTNPLAGNKTNEETPLMTIQLMDESGIDEGSVKLQVDRLFVTDWDETNINQTLITHQVTELLPLTPGNHTVNLTVSDKNGNTAEYQWEFSMDPEYGKEEEEVNYFQIFLYSIGAILVLVIIGVVASAIYLKTTKDFNFVKFYKRHPLDYEKVSMYGPMIIGVIIILGGLLYWNQYDVDVDYFIEYVVIGGFFIFFTAFTVYVQIEKRNTLNYERAFSQLLFELADAMRGGIDPAKAIVELSNTNTGILSKQLKIGTKNIKAGRPFEEVLHTIAKPTRSNIIMRYATLIGESSKVGGEISQVVHRSAKDMDDMLKVKDEKRRQLVIQIFTIYISFGVLMAIMWMLIGMYPKLIEMDFSLLTNFNLEAVAESQEQEATNAVRMSIVEIKRKFFHLILINSLGSGLLIGKLIDGKMKYGLVHGLIMMAIASFIFFVLVF